MGRGSRGTPAIEDIGGGYTPDGSPFLIRDRGTNDIYIYALDVDFLKRPKAR
jgi:hypothetical protein